MRKRPGWWRKSGFQARSCPEPPPKRHLNQHKGLCYLQNYHVVRQKTYSSISGSASVKKSKVPALILLYVAEKDGGI